MRCWLTAGWLIERLGYQAGFTGVAIMWTLGAGILLFIRSGQKARVIDDAPLTERAVDSMLATLKDSQG